MKYKEATRRVKFRVFNSFDITVVRTTNMEASVRRRAHTKSFFDRDGDIRFTEGLAVHYSNDKAEHSYIFLKWNCSMGTVAHEAYHVVRRVFEWHNVAMENEAVAYHLGYLVSEILKAQ